MMDVLTPTDPETADPAAPRDPAVASPTTPGGPTPGPRVLPPRVVRWLRAAGPAVAGLRRRRYSRVVPPGVLIFALVGTTVLAGTYVVPALPTTVHRNFTLVEPATDEVPSPPADEVPGADPSAAADGGTAAPAADPGSVTRPSDLAAWAAPLAAKLGIPLPAMQAYGYAELVTSAASPNCQLRWTTLAGIGKVESAHGQDHAVLGADGTAVPPILGAPLDGRNGSAKIADTDGGRLDHDSTWDHAVGPMQFIPSTWASYGTDADGNGVADINNVNDAALAAARYLCAGNRNLSLPGDWWAAIMSYNAVQKYVRDVFDAANDYGVRSH